VQVEDVRLSRKSSIILQFSFIHVSRHGYDGLEEHSKENFKNELKKK